MQTPEQQKQMCLDMQEHPEKYSEEQLEAMMDDLDRIPDVATAWQEFDSQMAARPLRRWLKVAAMFIGILMVSGVALAAYHYAFGGGTAINDTAQKAQISKCQPSQQQEQTETGSIRTFENAELQQILQELSDHYHVGVEFRNEQSRHIRLYTKWDTSAPLKQIIELLNGFEKVTLRLSDNHIIAE